MGSILPPRSLASQPGLESHTLNVVDLHNQQLRRFIPAARKNFPTPGHSCADLAQPQHPTPHRDRPETDEALDILDLAAEDEPYSGTTPTVENMRLRSRLMSTLTE
ncbi:hypothetical protein [Nocardia sp. MW-W600-9]